MYLSNLKGLPDAFVAAVANDPYQSGGDISVTKLIDAPQKRVLYAKYKEFVVEDVSQRVWALMGQAVHAVLERAQTTAMVEQRLYMEINGWSVSGQFDRLHLDDKCLQDWKVCSTYKSEGDVAWERQLNCLAELARHNGYNVEKLEVIAIYRDWRKAEAERDPTYPQQPVAVILVPLWTSHECQVYMRERVMLHQDAEAGDVTPCTEQERWYTGTKFALIKEGGVRASKVADTPEQLGEVKPGYVIQERKGMSRRCEGYCEVAQFCPQFQKEKQS